MNGLTIGSIYGLVGLGFALVYGVLGLINFAHGELYMIGAFLSFSAVVLLGIGFVQALLLSVVLTGLLGVLVERVAFKPIRKASHISQLISTLAVSIVLRNAAMFIWGSRTLPFPNVIGDALQTLIPLLDVLLMSALHLMLTRTKLGIAVRATSLDPEMAATLGVNTDRLIAVVFALGSALAGLAGVLVGMYYASITFDMGISMGLKAFVAAIIGGLGSIYGPILGGLMLGVAESLVQAYLSTSYKDALAFVALILMLLVRPAGLLGVTVEKRG